MPVLSGVVVQWGDPSELRELVQAWPWEGGFELVVVDNGPRWEGVGWEGVEARARVVREGRNLGFGGGANAGVRAATAEVVLILNPDVRVEREALESLVEGFARHPEATGLVPRMLGRDGEPQFRWQLRPLPTLGELLLQALGWPAATEAPEEPAEGAAVEQPAAAALALRRSAFEELGGFDPGFFPAWFEDVDLALRLRQRGHRLLYWPTAVVRHGLGGTVGQLGYGRFLWTYQRNLARYLRKHHGPTAAVAGRLLLPAGLLLRLLLLPLRKPRRAPSRGAAAQGLLGALAGALTGWRAPAAWTALRPEPSRPSKGTRRAAAGAGAGSPEGQSPEGAARTEAGTGTRRTAGAVSRRARR